jgi:uncharacterized protein YjbI with pentapeptide repeats
MHYGDLIAMRLTQVGRLVITASTASLVGLMAFNSAQAFDPGDVQNLLQNNVCAECDLSGADLSYIDLRGANLRNADLRNADLSYSDLSYSDLRGADLRGANTVGTIFEGIQR